CYSPTGVYLASGGSLTQTVNTASTTTTITSNLSTATVVGQAYTVNYTVAITAPGSGTLTGNVTVSDGTSTCIATEAAGNCSLTSTTPGAKTVTATYAGDSNFGRSTSAGVSHTVNTANTTTTISSNLSTATVVGQSYTVNYSVAVTAPGSGTPTGNVTVSDGTDTCIATRVAGTCSLTSSTAGAKTVIATYAGDSNYNGSASAGTAHTVNVATATTISLDPTVVVVGGSSTVNVTVSTI